MWAAFFEIYNESVYDLLQPSLSSVSKKRASLRVCDDGAGNAYVKGLSGWGGGTSGDLAAHTLLHLCRSEVDQHPDPGRSFKTAPVWKQKQKRRGYQDEPVVQQKASLFSQVFPVACRSDATSPSSHSIFTMKLLKIDNAEVKRLSE